MKKAILTLAITVFIGTSLTVQAQAQDTKQTSNQQDKSADVQKFRKEVNEKIKENEKRIAELRTKKSEENQEVKMKYDKKIDALEQKNKELKKKMADYREDGKETNWQSFKKEFNHDMDELAKALKSVAVDDVK
ncbi:MAG: hypothetical protein ACT4ON_00150 [Bacteroidota bacterium]